MNTNRVVVAPAELRAASATFRATADDLWQVATAASACHCVVPPQSGWLLEDLSGIRGELADISLVMHELASQLDAWVLEMEHAEHRWVSVDSSGRFGGAVIGGQHVSVALPADETAVSSASGVGIEGTSFSNGLAVSIAPTYGVSAVVVAPTGVLSPQEALGLGTVVGGSMSTMPPMIAPAGVLGSSAPLGATVDFGGAVVGGNSWATPEIDQIRAMSSQMFQSSLTAGPAPRIRSTDPFYSLATLRNPSAHADIARNISRTITPVTPDFRANLITSGRPLPGD